MHTRLIDDTEASKWFEWLATKSDLDCRDGITVAFRNEIIPPYKPAEGSLYFVTYDNEANKELLLTKVTRIGSSYGISFARLFNKSSARKIEAHLWLKNALEEKIIPMCLSEESDNIQAYGMAGKGEKVLCRLKDLSIKNVKSIRWYPPTLQLLLIENKRQGEKNET